MQAFGKIITQTTSQQRKSSLLMNAVRTFTTYNYEVKARVQKPAPHFEGMSWYGDAFKKISLKDYEGKYVVLFTYPLDFTFVCPTEISEVNDTAEHFRKNSKYPFSTMQADLFIEEYQPNECLYRL